MDRAAGNRQELLKQSRSCCCPLSNVTIEGGYRKEKRALRKGYQTGPVAFGRNIATKHRNIANKHRKVTGHCFPPVLRSAAPSSEWSNHPGVREQGSLVQVFCRGQLPLHRAGQRKVENGSESGVIMVILNEEYPAHLESFKFMECG